MTIAIAWLEASTVLSTRTITEKQGRDVVLSCRFDQLTAFLKSNGSSLSALSPRRVKREMKMRLIAFYACQLNAYFIYLDEGRERKKKKSPVGNQSFVE